MAASLMDCGGFSRTLERYAESENGGLLREAAVLALMNAKRILHGDTDGTEKREISACNLEYRVEFGTVNAREVDVGKFKCVGTSVAAALLVGCRVLNLVGPR